MNDREHPLPPPPDFAPEPDTQNAIDADESSDPASTLSPAVRRLVRQYDLDVTGIHGSGPSGRIRVGDVIAVLGGRAETAPGQPTDPAKTIPAADDPLDEPAAETPYRSSPQPASISAAAKTEIGANPTSTVFECDLSRVLAHRKRRRGQSSEIMLASYYLVACSEALKLVPEVMPMTMAGRPHARFGLILSSADGTTRTMVVDAAEDPPLGSIDDRLAALDTSLRTVAATAWDVRSSGLLVHHHGSSGSLITTPTPIGEGHAASLGLGRVRRQIVVRSGDQAPKIAALCYVTLSFYPGRIELHRASRFLSQFVRVLEQWPE